MSEIAVNVAVLQDHNILLTQRDDFETWILPGGGVDDGESLAQAAIRETKEETGLDVELTSLVGIYSRKGNALSGHIVLFTAVPVGGEIGRQAGETIAVEWFPFDQIPAPLHLGHARRIEDIINGKGGSVCVTQEFDLPNYPKDRERKELYALRDQSGLSRQEFYLRMIEGGAYNEKMEVGE
jgi:ADP-ribose pyrophosphatase YjhB (NUDIX family)